jgi:hypothetical protein
LGAVEKFAPGLARLPFLRGGYEGLINLFLRKRNDSSTTPNPSFGRRGET